MKKLYFIATICILINSSCSMMNSGYYFSKKIPNDVVLNQGIEGKCIATGLGSAVTGIYRWPDTEEGQEIFNEWWNHAGNMGTMPFLLPDPAPYRLYFSKQLWISFADDYYITYHYGGKENIGSLFVRRKNKYDRALFQYILNQISKGNKLSQEKAEDLGKKCTSYFEYLNLNI